MIGGTLKRVKNINSNSHGAVLHKKKEIKLNFLIKKMIEYP